MRLKDIITSLPFAITLERTRPPSIEQVRNAVANQRHRAVHFMGHGGQFEHGAALCFEKDNGDLDLVEAKKFAKRIHGSTFLATLNTCVSAAPGSTSFSNLAATLARQGVPYALGMRLSIDDEDSLLFSRAFYNDLARGTSVEEALFQARLTLASNSVHPWVVGIPVLYTSLAAPATGFMRKEGTPVVLEHQPRLEVSMLPRAEGIFQGRTEDLKQLGIRLTGNKRPRILTIHGGGGLGKTALAREAVERFAYAWPDGVWSTTLENQLDRSSFVADLARFLGINAGEIDDPKEVERRILARLASHHFLLVLDNAETLVDAVEADDPTAIQLAQFLQHLPNTSVSLLVTSRIPLGWVGETLYELEGLSPNEGVDLFAQCAPQKTKEIKQGRASIEELSKKVEGHPLSLRLLGSAFNMCTITLDIFIKEYEDQLMQAQHKYRDLNHRHRSLYACIDTSVRYLSADLCNFLSNLWIFHAPFLLETAVAIFDPDAEDTQETPSLVHKQLYTLWQRSLLTRKDIIVRDGTFRFYYLLPTTRSYIEQHMQSAFPREILFSRFGAEYAHIARSIYNNLDSSGLPVRIAQQATADLERGITYVTGTEQANYKIEWASILYRLGTPQRSLKMLEEVLEQVQGYEQDLTAFALNHMGEVYQNIGQPLHALGLYEQALTIRRELGERSAQATTLNNIGMAYNHIGQPQSALSLLGQALTIRRELGERFGEATTLSNMGLVYNHIGQPQRALSLLEQALTIRREGGNRLGEAATLSNMAYLYESFGQHQRALDLYAQVFTIDREIGDRAGEANTLNSIGLLYQHIEQPQSALNLLKQSLTIRREIGDRAGEASTLNNMGLAYQDLKQPQEALSLYEQALPIMREVSDYSGEARTLNNIGLIYHSIEQPQRALSFFEQALAIQREIGDRAGEAGTLTNMGAAYQDLKQFQRALSLYEQALPITREVGERPGEATALANMGVIYQNIGQFQNALDLYEQALTIERELGHQTKEASLLIGMGNVYQLSGHSQRALSCYEQALLITRKLGNREAEAATLNDMAVIYNATRQFRRALGLYEQVLLIMRELGKQVEEANILNSVATTYNTLGEPQRALSPFQQALLIIRKLDDRATEAAILNNMGLAHQLNRQPQEALSCYEQTLPILQKVGNRPMEATTLANIATLLYQQFNRTQEAINYLEQAINILNQMGLRQDAAGQSLELFNHWLQAMQDGKPLISQADIVDESQNEEVVDRQTENLDLVDIIIRNTLAVLGPGKDKQQEWYGTLVQLRSQVREQGIQNLVGLLDAIIGLLDAKGNPEGLGANLAGAEAKIWQDIVAHLSKNG